MQFQVPQFIEVEDKIFGPLTFRQFVFIGGGVGMCYLLWRILPLIIAAPLIAGVGGIAAALAFMQYNGRPFIVALETAFYYGIRSKLYLWNNQAKKKTATVATLTPSKAPELYVPKLSESKLHELAWSLDIKERIAAGVASDDDRSSRIVLPIRTPGEVITRLQH